MGTGADIAKRLTLTGGGGSPAGPTGSFQYNNGGSFGGAGTLDASGNATFLSFTGLYANLTTTIVAGGSLINTTAATNAAQTQNSPALSFIGHGWDSMSNLDRQIKFVAYETSTTPGFGVPTGILQFAAQVGAGALTNVFSIDSTGKVVISGVLSAQSQLLIGGPFTANSIGSFNGPVIAYAGLTANGFIANTSTLNGITTFSGDLQASDSNFYYTYANKCLSLGFQDTSATLSVSSTLAITTADPSSISNSLQQVTGPPTGPSISPDAAGNFYTANGSTYACIIFALDGSGNLNLPTAPVSFTDPNDGSLFQIDFACTAPTSAPSGISQYLIGLSINGAAYNYRLTGSSSITFTDNDGNYPYPDLTSFNQTYGYLADGNTLNITYNIYNYQSLGPVNVYSTGNVSTASIDPADNNYYIVSLGISTGANWKIIRSNNQTGAFLGTGSSLNDESNVSWSASSVITPTTYIKPAARFVGGGGIFSDGYNTSSGQAGATTNVSGLTFSEGLYISGSLSAATSVSNSDGTLNFTPNTGSVVGSLNLAHANTWTATQTFSNAIINTAGMFSMPIATGATGGTLRFLANTTTSNGRAWDISSDQFVNGDFAIRRSVSNSSAPSVSTVEITRDGLIGLNQSTPTDWLHLTASNTSFASLRIPSGTAPTSPNDGAIWQDGTHLFARLASGNRQLDRQVTSGSFSGVGTATTTFTVTIGTTQANTTYKVNVTPTAVLSAAVFYVNNKTTTTFDVVYLAGLTGTVTFDWILAP